MFCCSYFCLQVCLSVPFFSPTLFFGGFWLAIPYLVGVASLLECAVVVFGLLWSFLCFSP